MAMTDEHHASSTNSLSDTDLLLPNAGLDRRYLLSDTPKNTSDGGTLYQTEDDGEYMIVVNYPIYNNISCLSVRV